jgi:hypothetical protein
MALATCYDPSDPAALPELELWDAIWDLLGDPAERAALRLPPPNPPFRTGIAELILARGCVKDRRDWPGRLAGEDASVTRNS